MKTRLTKWREVTILPHTIDRYGRTVADVISDININTNINLALVEEQRARGATITHATRLGSVGFN